MPERDAVAIARAQARQDAQRAARRAWLWREGALLFGFVAVLIAAAVTVALPELSDAPDPDEAVGKPPAGEQPSASPADRAQAPAATP